MKSIKETLMNAVGDAMSKHAEDQFGCVVIFVGEPNKPEELIMDELDE